MFCWFTSVRLHWPSLKLRILAEFEMFSYPAFRKDKEAVDEYHGQKVRAFYFSYQVWYCPLKYRSRSLRSHSLSMRCVRYRTNFHSFSTCHLSTLCDKDFFLLLLVHCCGRCYFCWWCCWSCCCCCSSSCFPFLFFFVFPFFLTSLTLREKWVMNLYFCKVIIVVHISYEKFAQCISKDLLPNNAWS